jgi:hypothetical protein
VCQVKCEKVWGGMVWTERCGAAKCGERNLDQVYILIPTREESVQLADSDSISCGKLFFIVISNLGEGRIAASVWGRVMHEILVAPDNIDNKKNMLWFKKQRSQTIIQTLKYATPCSSHHVHPTIFIIPPCSSHHVHPTMFIPPFQQHFVASQFEAA